MLEGIQQLGIQQLGIQQLGIQKLRWPNFTQLWPPTHPEPLSALLLPQPHLKYCHVPHFYQHNNWVSLQMKTSDRKFNFIETLNFFQNFCPHAHLRDQYLSTAGLL